MTKARGPKYIIKAKKNIIIQEKIPLIIQFLHLLKKRKKRQILK